jgi:hypothetical protein
MPKRTKEEKEAESAAYNEEFERKNAESLLSPKGDKLEEAAQKISFLENAGKKFLLRQTPKKDIVEAVKRIEQATRTYKKSLETIGKDYPKAIKFIGESGAFGDSGKVGAFPIFQDYCEGLERKIHAIQAAKSALQNERKNSFLTEGFSHQDEFIGFCLMIFEEFRPGDAAKSEDNDFHQFCRCIFSLVHKKSYEESLINSLKKILP